MHHCPRGKRRRAVVVVQILVTLPVLFGFAAITVDVGVMYNAMFGVSRPFEPRCCGGESSLSW